MVMMGCRSLKVFLLIAMLGLIGQARVFNWAGGCVVSAARAYLGLTVHATGSARAAFAPPTLGE